MILTLALFFLGMLAWIAAGLLIGACVGRFMRYSDRAHTRDDIRRRTRDHREKPTDFPPRHKDAA